MHYLDNQKIYLLGMPYSGKSTLGKELAKLLDFDFYDLDIFIERKEGMSISEIFNQKGEDYFRIKERDYLKEITNKEGKIVLSLGGGTPCYHGNIDYINLNGISIFLDVGIETLNSRAKYSKNRPLLEVEDKKERMKELFESRRSYYEKASISISGDLITADKIKLLLEISADR